VADPSRDADPARPDHSPGTGTIAGGFGDESRRPQVACDQLAQLRAQVEANDLTPAQARSLQARVDRVVARTDGTQVAINQVVWDGGDTLIPLPGEERARELGVAARGTVNGCYRQLITRTQPVFYKGTVPEWIGHATHYIRPC
jgi:hypothetical protein